MTEYRAALMVSSLLFLGMVGGCGEPDREQEEQREEEPSPACTIDADCDDDVACTDGECVDGDCEYTPQDEECDGDVCREGVCNPAVGCQTVPLDDGTSCPRGVCSDGECVECIEAGDCETDDRSCVRTACRAGTCEYVPDDGLCDEDGLECTRSMCTTEGCRRIPDDSACKTVDECTIGVCDPDEGCRPEPVEFGTSCPRGVCVDGECRECGTSVELWNNGPLVTHTGTGADDYDESRLQNQSLDMSALGFNVAGNRWIAEGFRIEEGGWYVDSFVVYAYQTGSDRESTFEEVRYEIRDGAPDEPGSSVVHGDRDADALREGRFSGIYRTSESNGGPEADSRPIMELEIEVDTHLEPGNYWVVWRVDGRLDSGPWAPPITRIGQAATGNALRSTGGLGSWQPLEDSETGAPQGLPLDVYGHAASCSD